MAGPARAGVKSETGVAMTLFQAETVLKTATAKLSIQYTAKHKKSPALHTERGFFEEMYSTESTPIIDRTRRDGAVGKEWSGAQSVHHEEHPAPV